MFDKIAQEFMAIVRHLLRQPDPRIKDDRLLVPREKLIGMLDKHPYLTSTDKLTAWRTLRWIDADEKHFTRLVREQSGRERMILICLSVYREIEYLRGLDA